MIITLALSPSLDVTYEVDELRPGDITRPSTITRVAGGKALNVARTARALGAEVRTIAALGGYLGAWVAHLLDADGVPADIVQLAGSTRTCTAVVERGGGTSSTDLYEKATPLLADEWQAFRCLAHRVIGEARPTSWVAFSGSLPAGVAAADMAELLRAARAAGARTAVDSSGSTLLEIGGAADLVKINRSEAAETLGREFDGARDAAHALRERWGCDAIVTDGVRGGFALVGDQECAVPAPTVLGRFSAGSGDAFLGGLLTAFDAHRDLAQALELGRISAERNAQVAGQGVLAPM